MIDDALALGVKHAALNVNLAQLVDLPGGKNSIIMDPGEGPFRFSAGYVRQLDHQVKDLSDAGVIVTMIILVYQSSDEELNHLMLHPKYDRSAPNHLGAFNTTTADGTKQFQACIEFLSQRYSQPDGRYGKVWNYIIGNEVNSHWFWANMGRVSMDEFADDYLKTVRIAHQAIRKYSANARVYISLEHHWNIRYPGGDAQQSFAGRPFVEYFARRARELGDFDWNIAFHPYPENLFEPKTWNDRSATFQDDTPRITFKNIELLVRFLNRPGLKFNGKQRHLILSEQGFHTPNGPDGELVQAAAYCYAFYKINHIGGIDSFILHRHVDHRDEGGLRLGLWTRKTDSASPAEPEHKKKIYDVFRLADTDQWENAFEFALPIIGIKKWDELLLSR